MNQCTEQTKNTLPQDVAALQSLVLSLQEELSQLQNKYQLLLEQLGLAKHKIFSKQSEKSSYQTSLFDEPGIGSAPDTEQANNSIIPEHKRRLSGKRSKLPEDIPCEEIIIDVADEQKRCVSCHKLRPQIGCDITEKLDIVPLQLKRIHYIRPKYGHCCDHDGVIQASLPRLFLPKCIAAPGLASHIIVNKYQDHLPLYRQATIFARYGIDYPRASMCRTIVKAEEYCAPLINLLKEAIVRYHYTQADETTVQVLNESGRKNTSKSYIWCYKGGPPEKQSIVFEYQPSRRGANAENFLVEFQGHLQCDGFSGYNFIEANERMTRGGCLAHARRKFADVIKLYGDKGKAGEAIRIFAKLYHVEKVARENHFSFAQRFELRRDKSLPLMIELKEWLDAHVHQVPTQSKLGGAFHYTINQWPYLMAYLDDGEYQIDNNEVENWIRPFALGRRNWLFMGSPQGAKAGACFYSLIATAKAHQLQPFDYLKHVFTHIRDCVSQEDYKKLLPFNVKAEFVPS